MRLSVDIDIDIDEGDGARAGLDTVWLHGFTQTARSWAPLLAASGLRRLGGRRLRVDLPGHGDSPHASGDLWTAGHSVVDSVVAHGVERAVLIGYSLGGRTALHALLTRPALWCGAVLIGTTPGLSDPAARRDRRRADERLADRLAEIGVDAFLDEWLSQPLFARLPQRPEDLADRRRNTVEGLASSLRHCGTGTQDDLRWRLNELTMPVLILAGAHDTKFVAAGRELAESWGGDARFAQVPEAGHAAHLERPDATADLIGTWLSGLS